MTTDPAPAGPKTELDRAIRRYAAAVDPDLYVDSWVLGIHHLSPKLEQAGRSGVALVVPTDQSFVITRGVAETLRDITAK